MEDVNAYSVNNATNLKRKQKQQQKNKTQKSQS